MTFSIKNMVNACCSGNRGNGLKDWYIQRGSAVVMALFTLVVLVSLLIKKGPIDYTAWAGVFAPQWMRMLTFVVIVALAYHAWIGVRDVYRDYIKPPVLRMVLNFASVVWILACIGWALQVLFRF